MTLRLGAQGVAGGKFGLDGVGGIGSGGALHRAREAWFDEAVFPQQVHHRRHPALTALLVAQQGGKDRNAKPLKGFSGAGVLEIADDHDGDTFRAVYTVRFADAVYVLHAFQKKSKRGLATPRQEIELIRQHLAAAEAHHASSRRQS